MPELTEVADRLAAAARAALAQQGADPARVTMRRSLHLRYAGTEAALIIALRDPDAIVTDFTAAHRARFGFATPERPLVVEAVAVEATFPGRSGRGARRLATRHGEPTPIDIVPIFWGETGA